MNRASYARRVFLAALTGALGASVFACSSPSVELPKGNDKKTSDTTPSDLAAPSVPNVPSRYPFSKVAIRGTAGKATRVLIEGAGNAAVGGVQPIDGSFCVMVELAAAPAEYTLEVRGQGPDGRLSGATIVRIQRANDAPAPADSKLCDGTPAS